MGASEDLCVCVAARAPTDKMKTHVNLLVPDLFGEDQFPFQKVVLPVSFLFLVLAILAGTAVESTRSRSLKAGIKDLNQRKAYITQSLDSIKEETGEVLRQTEAAEGGSREKEQLLQQLQQVRIPWADLLREVSVLIPDNVWLTHMEGVEEPQGGNSSDAVKSIDLTKSVRELKFVGFGTSHVAVTQWMSALERSRYFKDVTLVFADKKTDEERSRVNFEIQVTFK
ncbi:MAG: PilN domain-containing protein [Nitrospira sp.]|nr:PilN domain-containing protein [Nitrospira sp.]